jgi:chemotaxis signal transduction protein
LPDRDGSPSGPPPGDADDLLGDELAGLVEELAASPMANVAESSDGPAPVPDASRRASEGRLGSLRGMLLRIDERTRAARATRELSDEGARLRCLTFSAAGCRYGVPLANVSEVARVPVPSRLPYVPPWLLGITNLRGHIVPLLDFGPFLSGRPREAGAPGRMVVVHPVGGQVAVAFVVDLVHGIREYARTQVRQPAAAEESGPDRYVSGTCDDEGGPVRLLDVDRLLASDEVKAG